MVRESESVGSFTLILVPLLCTMGDSWVMFIWGRTVSAVVVRGLKRFVDLQRQPGRWVKVPPGCTASQIKWAWCH